MRVLLFAVLAAISYAQTEIHASPTCAGAEKICAGISFPASTTSETVPPASNCYGSVTSQPNPAWFVFEIAPDAPESVQLTIKASEDVDHVLWGPFNSVEDAHGNCGSLTCTGIIDDDFSGDAVTSADVWIPNASEGDVYILLITNYGGGEVDIDIELAASSQGAISCDGVPGAEPNSVNCQMTIDNALTKLRYNGEDITTGSGVWDKWDSTKSFSFNAVDGAYLEIWGNEHDWFSQGGCKSSGLLLECDNGFISSTAGWEAIGSAEKIGNPSLGYGSVCVSTSTFKMNGQTSEAMKIWPSNGEKWAYFRAIPTALQGAPQEDTKGTCPEGYALTFPDSPNGSCKQNIIRLPIIGPKNFKGRRTKSLCAQKCSEDWNCYAFDYNPRNGACFINTFCKRQRKGDGKLSCKKTGTVLKVTACSGLGKGSTQAMYVETPVQDFKVRGLRPRETVEILFSQKPKYVKLTNTGGVLGKLPVLKRLNKGVCIEEVKADERKVTYGKFWLDQSAQEICLAERTSECAGHGNFSPEVVEEEESESDSDSSDNGSLRGRPKRRGPVRGILGRGRRRDEAQEVIGSTHNAIMFFAAIGAMSIMYYVVKGFHKMVFRTSEFEKIVDMEC